VCSKSLSERLYHKRYQPLRGWDSCRAENIGKSGDGQVGRLGKILPTNELVGYIYKAC